MNTNHIAENLASFVEVSKWTIRGNMAGPIISTMDAEADKTGSTGLVKSTSGAMSSIAQSQADTVIAKEKVEGERLVGSVTEERDTKSIATVPMVSKNEDHNFDMALEN